MRTSKTVLILALAFVLPAAISAQQPAPANEPTPPIVTKFVADFGARGTTTTGDASRYERFRDMSDGVFLETARFHREQYGWVVDGNGDHVGRQDQKLWGTFVKPGKFKGSASWDEIPLLMSRTTQTIYTNESGGALLIPNNTQSFLQNGTGNACVPAGYATCIAQVADQNAVTFDLESHRHIADFAASYLANQDVTINGGYTHTTRAGTLPYGGTFGFSNAIELPAPIDNRLEDVNASAEYAHGDLMVRGGYTGSFFHNNITEYVWDNPYRVSDQTPVTGTQPNVSSLPFQGRMPTSPSSNYFALNGTASYKLPSRSRVTAYVSRGWLKDVSATTIMPQTINTVLLTQPGISTPERATVDGQGDTKTFNLTFTSKPKNVVDINARYRYYTYDNLTPLFGYASRVNYDTAIATGANETEPFGITRKTFDIDGRFLTKGGLSAGVGYTRNDDDRTFRIFESSAENTFRLVGDMIATKYATVRAKYEHSTRTGTVEDEVFRDQTGCAAAPAPCNDTVATAEHAGLRRFDVADRNRDRFTFIGTTSPTGTVLVTGSFATGNDDYPNSDFGLLSNKHYIYSIGVDQSPMEGVMYGLSYNYEHYHGLAQSRQNGSSLPNADFSNPAFDWSTDSLDQIHSLIANLGYTKGKYGAKFYYDFNKSTSTYTYVDIGSKQPVPAQLAPVKSSLHDVTFDVTRDFSAHLGVGFSYWYEKYTVDDFALDPQAIPRLDLNGSLLIGYAYQPYTAQTFWGRVFYKW
jgi:MtrB/PioB family decaheme-associated outer membrane protein